MPQAIASLVPSRRDAAVDPRMHAMIDNILLGSPVARALGVRLAGLAPEHIELEMPFLPTNVTHGSTVHGGVIATLIDIAGAAAAASGANADEVKGGATSSLSIQYLAPAQGAALRAVAAVVRRGRRQVATEVSVYAETANEGVLVAKALMSSAMF
ncbi:PaaI family thioesterase [Cupriavidus oxalaticus]|uniref:Acyl-CoA thioesterase n=1 Tax=Cupriavidus oxalaticus TaxID=96344 RepID=A0A375G3G2_9BURK|nr:PaaI family thioesterase [Cupriavidus oxalaticus]QEZ46727.1 PaaI family thioesterase [Cupriavidus oxalaticus]QRQ88946.1 PaaI family thioesterase [Cupriavidus oxalaticus]QRQ92728.1 PaaI family thioesterase [Cupriavidus oxalaticus]WQD81332.1 PaaI family thioesterase [Cupriavidus oxalaticus]SPC12628.1 Acyl-CoA thioesterase [Cupriavidus oxalaticus]